MSKLFGWQEIEKHNSAVSPWLVIDGKVYDVTEFQHKHPGILGVFFFFNFSFHRW